MIIDTDRRLELATSDVEAGLKVCVGRPWPECETGDRYVEVEMFDASADKAIEGWLVKALGYREGKSGILYWRVRPELEYRHDPRAWQVYSRFVISAKPVLEALVDQNEMAMA